VDSNQLQDTRQGIIALEAQQRLSARVEARLLLGADARRDSTDNAPDSPGDTLGFYAYEGRTDYARYAADLRADVRVSAHATASVGAVVEEQRERGRNSYQSEFGNGAGSTDVARTNRGAYLQLAADQGRAGIQAGVRLDDNQAFGSFVTWRAGASVRLAPATRLRMSAGTAFKEPTFDENCRGLRVESGAGQAEHDRGGGRSRRWRLTLAARVRGASAPHPVHLRGAAPTDPNFYNAERHRVSLDSARRVTTPGRGQHLAGRHRGLGLRRQRVRAGRAAPSTPHAQRQRQRGVAGRAGTARDARARSREP
jgi:outer membrane receptor protein involved in Fe transport